MKIHAIQTGTVRIKRNQRVGKGRSAAARQLNLLLGSEWTEPLPIYAWAIEHPEGVIVVDTGDTARTGEPGYFPRWHPYYRTSVAFDITPQQEIGPQLRALGLEPETVHAVVLTHFHTDHAGGLHHFPNSKVFASAGDYENARGLAGKLRGYLPHRWPRAFTPTFIPFERVPLGPFGQNYPLTKAGDVIVVPTPGHTPGHVSVIIKTADLNFFLAGDASYSQALLVAGKPDAVGHDVGTIKQTMGKILDYARAEPTVYLPSHDAESANRLARRDILVVPE